MNMRKADAGQLLRALATTGAGLLAFAGLQFAGAAAQTSLIGALVVAGALNIAGTAALNGDLALPTSEGR